MRTIFSCYFLMLFSITVFAQKVNKELLLTKTFDMMDSLCKKTNPIFKKDEDVLFEYDYDKFNGDLRVYTNYALIKGLSFEKTIKKNNLETYKLIFVGTSYKPQYQLRNTLQLLVDEKTIIPLQNVKVETEYQSLLENYTMMATTSLTKPQLIEIALGFVTDIKLNNDSFEVSIENQMNSRCYLIRLIQVSINK